METEEITAPVLPEQPKGESRVKMLKRVLLGFGAVALLVLGGVSALLYSPESEANPTIAWAPSSLSLEVVLGQSTTVEATFTPSQNASNVSVEVVPELAPYVSVSPSSFPSVQKGLSHTVTVTAFATSGAPLDVYDGTIHLRQGKKTLARPLSVALKLIPIPLPPDPGEAGKVTIEGIDSDGDGVRDDVQIAIAYRYPYNADARFALNLFAKVLQSAFVAQNSGDHQQVNILLSDIVSATNCIAFSTPNPRDDIIMMEMIMTNTKERFEIYENVNAMASGQFFGGDIDPDNACQQ